MASHYAERSGAMSAPLTALALAALVAGAGCGPSAAERERCYAAAETAAQRRVERECPGLFDPCPASDDILAELRAAQEGCP
jgi:hypothetical protein